MSKHTQHYFDLNPGSRDTWATDWVKIWIGAAAAVVLVWAAVFIVFTL